MSTIPDYDPAVDDADIFRVEYVFRFTLDSTLRRISDDRALGMKTTTEVMVGHTRYTTPPGLYVAPSTYGAFRLLEYDGKQWSCHSNGYDVDPPDEFSLVTTPGRFQLLEDRRKERRALAEEDEAEICPDCGNPYNMLHQPRSCVELAEKDVLP